MPARRLCADALKRERIERWEKCSPKSKLDWILKVTSTGPKWLMRRRFSFFGTSILSVGAILVGSASLSFVGSIMDALLLIQVTRRRRRIIILSRIPRAYFGKGRHEDHVGSR